MLCVRVNDLVTTVFTDHRAGGRVIAIFDWPSRPERPVWVTVRHDDGSEADYRPNELRVAPGALSMYPTLGKV